MVQILDVMEKALEGKPMSETDYQLRRFAPKVAEKVREHGISGIHRARSSRTTRWPTNSSRLGSSS
jgi:hypothetical protein